MRPDIDVVVPFRGSDAERRAVLTRMRAIVGERDTLTIVENGPDPPRHPAPEVLHAPQQRSSYFARNRGAERGRAPWIVFLDADAVPAANLLDRYFEPVPGERVGQLGGGMYDEVDGSTLAARYAALRGAMSHENSLSKLGERWSYAQTANAAVRREAFEEAGGFTEGIRSAGDADFSFRLRAAGWELEARPEARVTHANRTSLRALARQRARHGSGAAWLDRRYPGVFPRKLGPRGAWWTIRLMARAPFVGRDERAVAIGEAVSFWAYELGRFASNEVR